MKLILQKSLLLAEWVWVLPIFLGIPVLWYLVNTADDAEALRVLVWAWTIGSSIGFLTTVYLIRRTWLELMSLRTHERADKALTLIAGANFRREVFRAIEFAALLGIGGMIIFAKVDAVLARFLLVLVVALLFGNTVLDLRERQQTSAILRRAIIDRARHK